MQAIVHTTWAAQLLRPVPAALLRVLDDWSHRVAQRRAQERQRKAKLPKAAPRIAYHLKPWRD
jgi:hypothetical protein